MDWSLVWKMLVLGGAQGATEFLPVSSSGHLVMGQLFLGVEGGITVPVFLHVGTLVAVVVFMARRIARLFADMFNREAQRRAEGWKLFLYLVIASLPAALVGLLAGDVIDRLAYSQPVYVSFFFAGTGAVLLATRWSKERKRGFGISDAILIGIAQAVAILPGFSRSGLTIATALLLGIASLEAFDFTFLLSIPVIAGAALLDFLKLTRNAGLSDLGPWQAWAAGLLASAGVGFLALWLVKKIVVSRKFWVFSFYCFAAGIASLVLLLVFFV